MKYLGIIARKVANRRKTCPLEVPPPSRSPILKGVALAQGAVGGPVSASQPTSRDFPSIFNATIRDLTLFALWFPRTTSRRASRIPVYGLRRQGRAHPQHRRTVGCFGSSDSCSRRAGSSIPRRIGTRKSSEWYILKFSLLAGMPLRAAQGPPCTGHSMRLPQATLYPANGPQTKQWRDAPDARPIEKSVGIHESAQVALAGTDHPSASAAVHADRAVTGFCARAVHLHAVPARSEGLAWTCRPGIVVHPTDRQASASWRQPRSAKPADEFSSPYGVIPGK